jgi:hypothetical protein
MSERPRALIVDRDGTLASVAWVAPVDRSGTAWERYNAALPMDAAVPEVVALTRAMRPGVEVLVVSGRMEGDWAGDRRRRFAMRRWLDRAGVPYDALFMRAGGDQRRDSVVKEEILLRDILPRWRPVFAIEDREEVAQVWERHGIGVLRVTDPVIQPLILQRDAAFG